MKKIILVCLVVFSFACKNEEKSIKIKSELPVKKEVVNDDIFKVFIDIKVNEDDKFQLFYVDDSPEGDFSVDKRLALLIKGDNNFQVIEFTLPANVFPYKFRVDLGENNLETSIEIRSIKLQYNNDVIEIGNLTLERFFQPNIYLEKTVNGYLRKTIDGRNDPFLLSTPLLIKKMELEL